MRQPITVEARFDLEGGILPMAFVWEERRHLVRNHDRQWENIGERRFLVQVIGQGTFELDFYPSEGRWSLIRTPADSRSKHHKRYT